MQMSYWLLETLTLVHTLQNKLGLLYLVVAPQRISFFDSRCPPFCLSYYSDNWSVFIYNFFTEGSSIMYVSITYIYLCTPKQAQLILIANCNNLHLTPILICQRKGTQVK